MTDGDKSEFKPNLVLGMGTLHTFSPIKARAGIGGEELEDPQIALVFRVPVDVLSRYMNVITGVWRKKKAVTIGLSFVEQMELMRKETLDKNGQGPAPTGLEPIPVNVGKKPAKKKRRETTRA